MTLIKISVESLPASQGEAARELREVTQRLVALGNARADVLAKTETSRVAARRARLIEAVRAAEIELARYDQMVDSAQSRVAEIDRKIAAASRRAKILRNYDAIAAARALAAAIAANDKLEVL